jgi:integrase
MGLFTRGDSPFWWMLLEGTGRKKESTGIRRDATSSEVRKLNRAKAEEVYHARMVQLARGRVGLPVETRTTFDAHANWYEQHHTAKHRSAPRERVIIGKLRAHFGSLLLSEIRAARWSEYVTARLADGVSMNTIGRELAVLKTMLAAAVGEHLEVSPLAHVKRTTTRLPPKRTLTGDDEARLLEQLRDEEIRDLYLVGVGTLLRQVNLVTLQRRQHQGARLVVQTKTGPHQVPLDGPTELQRRAAAVLERRMPATHGGHFFPKWEARFARDRDGANAKFLQGFRRACTRAGIPWGLLNHGVVWHTATRASGATRMLRDYGLDVRTVQLIGGWRSLDQMAEYLGVDLSVSAGTQREPKSGSGGSSRRLGSPHGTKRPGTTRVKR